MNQEAAKTPLVWRLLNLTLLVMQFLAFPLNLALAVQDRQFWQDSYEAFSGQASADWYYDIFLDWPIAAFAALLLAFSVAKEFFRLSMSQKLKTNVAILIVMFAVPLTVMYQQGPTV